MSASSGLFSSVSAGADTHAVHPDLIAPVIEISSDEEEAAVANDVLPRSSDNLSGVVEGNVTPTRVEDGQSTAKPMKLTKWGRCSVCQRAMRPRVREDGSVFLGCSRFETSGCRYTSSAMGSDVSSKLPERIIKRQKVST